jgi:hypothetical protein
VSPDVRLRPASFILLPWFQVAPAGVSGGRGPGPLARDKGDTCEARQSLKRPYACTRSRISHVTQVTRHSTVIRIVQPLVKE